MTPCLRSLKELDKEIEQTRSVLKKLYVEKKKLLAAAKVARPKRPSFRERRAEVYALAKQGQTTKQIASATGLKRITCANYLRWALYSDAITILGSDVPYEIIKEKMREIKRSFRS